MYLFATTTLAGFTLMAAHAEAEEGVQLGLSGFMNTYYGISSRDSTGEEESDKNQSHFQDATINFIGSTTLDNGIEVGVRFELESFGHPEDEQFMWFTGRFGEINLGGVNSAAYRMAFDAGPPAFASGIPINTGWVNTFIPAPEGWFTQFRTPALSTFIDTHNDANTVSYFSPRYAGFAFGLSWTPETGGTGEGQFGPVSEETQFNNALSAGVTYQQSFAGIDVGVHGGYNIAFDPSQPAIANGLGAQEGGIDDREQIMAGLSLSYAGFTFGGNWAHEDHDVAIQDSDGDGLNDFQTADGNSYAIGASYALGPWTFSVDSLISKIEGDPTLPGDDELLTIKGGVNYALGPGIQLSATLLYADWEEEGGVEEDAIGGILGTTVTF
jgi:hypothetical protein